MEHPPCPSPDQPPWVPVLAGFVPFLVYALSASAHGYWLDSAEFTAAAVQLDIPHPPGHPLANLWGKLFALFPVGPLPYRVALGQAVAAACAVSCAELLFARGLSWIGLQSRVCRVCLALAASWILAGAYGFWFQAVRAEVYALEALLVIAALERLTALACVDDARDPRPLYQACLALGLGLANHHFIAILALPALLPALVALTRARGPRVIGLALLSGTLGLGCYVYLPLRAATLPPMDLGHPVGWRDLFWVVSAQVYARHIGSEARQPLAERFADLLVILDENFTLWTLAFALLGSYALLRARRLWPLAYIWLVSALISLCGRAWLNPVRANPDVLGYMMPGFMALLALASAGVAVLIESAPERRGVRRALSLGCAALTALGLAQFRREAGRASLRTFHAGDEFDDLRRRALPTRALVLLLTPDTVFRHWEGEAVEQLRADVTLVPVPFLGYGGLDRVLIARHPELRELVRTYRERGALAPETLQALARERPVLLELDPGAALPLFPFTVPERLLYRVLPAPPAGALLMQAGRVGSESLARLTDRVGDDLGEVETRKQLLWSRYVETLYLAWHGAFELARESARSGHALAPHARELNALQQALAGAPQLPFDISPFLPPRAIRAR